MLLCDLYCFRHWGKHLVEWDWRCFFQRKHQLEPTCFGAPRSLALWHPAVVETEALLVWNPGRKLFLMNWRLEFGNLNTSVCENVQKVAWVALVPHSRQNALDGKQLLGWGTRAGIHCVWQENSELWAAVGSSVGQVRLGVPWEGELCPPERAYACTSSTWGQGFLQI